MICPLCLSPENSLYHQDKDRPYYSCRECSLVFVPREYLISVHAEKERYEKHVNDSESSGYRDYLTKIAEGIFPFLKEGEEGLDFGSGRSLLLAQILGRYGFKTSSFDIYFYPQTELLSKKYNFIILSEVIEHLRDPHQELTHLRKMLVSGGKIFLKTKLLPESLHEFSNWFYKRDKTHIQFFNQHSFEALSRLWGFLPPEEIGEDLYLFRDQGI